MIFGAMAAWQAWLLLVGAAALATWLFFLKVRPPRIVVPSLTLWRRVLDESREVSWWERVRRVVSLLLVLLTTAALVFAITRPARRQPAVAAAGAAAQASSRVLVVIDSSWSMLARTSGGETRWDRAIAEARMIAASAGGDEVAIATTGDGLVQEPTTDAALIESALDRIEPSGGEASAWPAIAGARAVHFITDGAIGRRLGAGVAVHSVFEAAGNVAITALDVGPARQADSGGEAYLEVANYASAPQQARVVLTRGSSTLFDRRLDMAAGEAIRQIVPLAREGGPELRARVNAPNNALVVDDEAVAWITQARPIAVTVVSDQPAPFGVLLQRDPGVTVTLSTKAAYKPGNEDITIFDRFVPHDPPVKPALYFAPPESSWLATPEADEKQPHWTKAGLHPVVRGVDPLTLTIARARTYRASASDAALVPLAVSDAGTPLVYAVEGPRRAVIVTFSPAESNLAFAPAFPVLIGNAIEWLARPESSLARRPGISTFSLGVSRVVAPNGKTVPLTRVGDSMVGTLRAPGFYGVEAGGARGVIPVNIGDPQISNLARTALGESAKTMAVKGGASPRPWWLIAVGIALAILAGEWWTWQRRITV
jgi:hypothetical protein